MQVSSINYHFKQLCFILVDKVMEGWRIWGHYLYRESLGRRLQSGSTVIKKHPQSLFLSLTQTTFCSIVAAISTASLKE